MNKSLPVYELFQAYILSAQRRSDFPLTAAVPEAVLRSSTTAGGRKPEIFCGPGHCGPKPTFVTNPAACTAAISSWCYQVLMTSRGSVTHVLARGC